MKIYNTVIWTLLNNSRRYRRLQNDEEKRLNSNSLGIRSLISTVCGIIFAVLCVWAISMLIEKSGTINNGGTLETLLIIIGIFILVILLVELVFQFIINGLYCAILQMKLNRKPIGYVALGLWIALFIAAIVIIAIVIF